MQFEADFLSWRIWLSWFYILFFSLAFLNLEKFCHIALRINLKNVQIRAEITKKI